MQNWGRERKQIVQKWEGWGGMFYWIFNNNGSSSSRIPLLEVNLPLLSRNCSSSNTFSSILRFISSGIDSQAKILQEAKEFTINGNVSLVLNENFVNTNKGITISWEGIYREYWKNQWAVWIAPEIASSQLHWFRVPPENCMTMSGLYVINSFADFQ